MVLEDKLQALQYPFAFIESNGIMLILLPISYNSNIGRACHIDYTAINKPLK